MYDSDVIAAINVDQLVTATDRLLIGNLTKRRPSARGTSDLTFAARTAVRASEERTLYVRDRIVAKPQLAVLATVAAIAWLAVVAVRLLA